MKVEAKIFVGRVLAPAIGGWITLPMEQNKLAEKIKELNVGEEYIISDYETDLPMEINEHSSPFQINDFIHFLKQKEEEGDLRLFLTAFRYRDYDLEDTLRILEQGNYRYFEDVEDTESLGEAVVRSGDLGIVFLDYQGDETPQMKKWREEKIVDLGMLFQYLDFEKIGNDLECNGCMIHKELKTAFMEVRPY